MNSLRKVVPRKETKITIMMLDVIMVGATTAEECKESMVLNDIINLLMAISNSQTSSIEEQEAFSVDANDEAKVPHVGNCLLINPFLLHIC